MPLTHKERKAQQRAWYHQNSDRILAEKRARHQLDPDATRAANLRWRYGVESYDALLEQQDGVCGICQEPPGGRVFHVDHCHETSAVRGLLCARCNSALGKFGDSPDRLRRALEWLSRA